MAKFGKLSIAGLLLLFFTSVGLAEEKEETRIDLVLPGSFHGNHVIAENGEEWFCLYKKGEECFLSKTKVRIDMYHDSSADEPITDTTGKKVSVPEIDGEAIFLFRGVNGVVEGQVKTVFHGERFVFPGESIRFHSTDLVKEREGKPKPQYRSWVVGALGTATNVDFQNTVHQGRVFYSIYDLHVIFGNRTQVICERGNVSEDDASSLIWAGDLDGDEKLDLYLDLSSHYNSYVFGLFLSSLAGDGECLKEAARFESWGC